MKKILLNGLLLSLMITSCTKEDMYLVDTELQQHVDSFESDLNVTIKGDISIRFEDEHWWKGQFELKGYAYGLNKSGVDIVISRKHYDVMSDLQKKALLYHELGHDVLNLYHTDEYGKLMSVGQPSHHNQASEFVEGLINEFIKENRVD